MAAGGSRRSFLMPAPWEMDWGAASAPGAPPGSSAPVGIQTPPALSGDMPVPSSPDLGAAYEQARDRWAATVARAKAQAQAQPQPQESATTISGAMAQPTGMAPPTWGPFGSREG